MNAPSSILALRRRNLWEAFDSGILLWKNNFFYFIPFFAVPVWVTAFALILIPNDFRWLSWLGLWWLKPLFDRLCLQVISSRFFITNPTEKASNGEDGGSKNISPIRAILKGLPRNFFPYLLGDLLWRRFSPFRSANMCLRLLERLKPKQYRERRKALIQGGINYSAILGCMGLPLEMILLGGEFIFVFVMFQFFAPNVDLTFDFGMENIILVVYIAYCVNYILVETLFICMGFGLYINCRTEMEGWDIQLLFQKFTQNSSRILKILVLCIGLFFVTLPMYAQSSTLSDDLTENTKELQEKREYFPNDFMSFELVPKDDLDEILSSDEFGGYRTTWGIRFKNDETGELPEIDIPLVENLKEYLALRAFIILVLAGFIVFALIRLRQLRRFVPDKKANGKTYTNSLITNEDPQTLFDRADNYFQRGLLREAWAACLCGTVSAYDQYFDLSFPPDATEYGCLDLVSCHFSSTDLRPYVDGFDDLVRNWVLLAYGGRDPGEGSFEKALAFGRDLKCEAHLE